MKIVASGITGFVGGYLKKEFSKKHGWQIEALGKDDFKLTEAALAGKMENADVIINLAGTPIAARWTKKHKQLIYNSRILTTRKMVAAMAKLKTKPRLFISTSAVGRYGPDGSNTEERGIFAADFLGKVAADWEAEALSAATVGVRTVIFRFGIVLGPGGGMLASIIPFFRLGLGGTIGNGKQPFSWVHIKDIARAFHTAIADRGYSGIYNLCSPNPTTNEGFTKALGRMLHRPTIFRIPVFVLKLKFGEGAGAFSSGQTVLPKRLMDAGFTFAYPDIDAAVGDIVTTK